MASAGVSRATGGHEWGRARLTGAPGAVADPPPTVSHCARLTSRSSRLGSHSSSRLDSHSARLTRRSLVSDWSPELFSLIVTRCEVLFNLEIREEELSVPYFEYLTYDFIKSRLFNLEIRETWSIPYPEYRIYDITESKTGFSTIRRTEIYISSK